jgi:hypothetical protein
MAYQSCLTLINSNVKNKKFIYFFKIKRQINRLKIENEDKKTAKII